MSTESTANLHQRSGRCVPLAQAQAQPLDIIEVLDATVPAEARLSLVLNVEPGNVTAAMMPLPGTVPGVA